jgi:transposase-like protein
MGLYAMSNKRTRKYLTAEEKANFILLCLRSNHSVMRCCREHGVPVSNYYKWLKVFVTGGTMALRRKVKPRKLVTKEATDSRDAELSLLRARHSELIFRESNISGHFSTKAKMHILELASASRLSQEQFTKCLEISRSSFNRWKNFIRSYGNIRPPIVGQPYVKIAE